MDNKFLTFNNNWSSHLPMLLLGLQNSEGDVIELGSGDGSTKTLREYCKEHGRAFATYDSNKDWADKCGAIHIPDWDAADIWKPCGLLFVDHAPGEHRIHAISRMRDMAEVIVIHDTEEGGAGDYKYSRIWPLFKYRLNYNRLEGGAGASAVSNKVDLHKFAGDFHGYKFEVK